MMNMRINKTLSLMLGAMLLISSLALLAAPALAVGGSGGAGQGPWSDGGGETPKGTGPRDDMYQKGVDKSLMGRMSYEYGHGQGGFVFYSLNEEDGAITDYGLITSDGEKVLIDSISVEGFVPEEVEVSGSIVRLTQGSTFAMIHDNPTGMYHLLVERPADVTIVLSGDMRVTQNRVLNDPSNLTYQLVISDGASSGVIASDDPFEVKGDGAVISCNVTDHLMIRFLPQVAHRHQWMEMVLMQAVQEGRVAAELTFIGDDDGGIYDAVHYRRGFSLQVQHVVRNELRFVAQGENPKGALMLIHTEGGTMDMSQERLRVRLDDKDLRFAEDPLELIYGQPEDACYSVLSDGDVQQMLVYLPASTLGSITVQSMDPLSALFTPAGTALILGVVAIVVLAGLMAFRKR